MSASCAAGVTGGVTTSHSYHLTPYYLGSPRCTVSNSASTGAIVGDDQQVIDRGDCEDGSRAVLYSSCTAVDWVPGENTFARFGVFVETEGLGGSFRSDSTVSCDTSATGKITLSHPVRAFVDYNYSIANGSGFSTESSVRITVSNSIGFTVAVFDRSSTGGDSEVHTLEGWNTKNLNPGTYTVSISGSESRHGLNSFLRAQMSASARFANIEIIPWAGCTGSNACSDVNNDGEFDVSDLLDWLAAPFDVTGNGEVDADPYGIDASYLADQLFATGQLGDDCNENAFPDIYDIAVGLAAGGSADANGDGVPDECDGPCNLADLAEPFDVIDLSDISAFIDAFLASDPLVDFDGNGVYDLADINAFVNAFTTGCP